MKSELEKRQSAIDLRERLEFNFPFIKGEQCNEYGAPTLRGTIALDMGLFLVFVDEMGVDSRSPRLAEILNVSELTCKNWIKKLRDDCLCDIEWSKDEENGSRFVVRSYGIFSTDLYNYMRPYVKVAVNNWRDTKYDRTEKK